ncbi:hypothetical protein ABFS82_02G174000 [Erythranthe guttata]
MAIQFFCVFLFLSLVHAQNNCLRSSCGGNGLAIQFPFWLQGKQPQTCGLSGFNLSCIGEKNAIVNIPYSGDFYVSSIYYDIKRVVLSDPDNCIPRRLLSLNLSSSPFRAVSYRTYIFLSCPKGSINSRYVVNCLSDTTTDMAAINYEAGQTIPTKCEQLFTSTLPISSPYGLPVNLELTWITSAIGTENKRPVSRTVALSFVIASMVIPVVIIIISCCICMMRRNNLQDSGSNQTSGIASSSDTVTPGLGISTIETYKKITIGESRRIEGPNDITCAICLVDYVPHDTIRVMPECQHCFHVECIDQWLSIRAKCPICRASQA